MQATVPKTMRLPQGLYRQLRQSMAENDTQTLSAEVVRQLTAFAAQPRIDGRRLSAPVRRDVSCHLGQRRTS